MMEKWKGIILIFIVQIIYLLGCASEDIRTYKPEYVQISCTFNHLEGECRYFKNGTAVCSTGTCSEGDCTTGKGVITYPGESRLEGIFKDGKLNGAGAYQGCSESFVGTFKNDFKEKGILASKKERKIYEGTFKDELKNGNFNVYLDYNGQFPFAENGKVISGVYSKKIAISYVMDIDKNIYDSQEKQRKEEAARRKKEEEDERRWEAQRKIEQAKEEKRRQAEEAQRLAIQRKEEAEIKQIENSVNARKATVEKAQKACEESRYEFSNECKTYETVKAKYEWYKDSICSYTQDQQNILWTKYWVDDNKNRELYRKFRECNYASER